MKSSEYPSGKVTRVRAPLEVDTCSTFDAFTSAAEGFAVRMPLKGFNV